MTFSGTFYLYNSTEKISVFEVFSGCPRNVTFGRFELNEKVPEWLKTLQKNFSGRHRSLRHITFSLLNARPLRNKAFQIHSARFYAVSGLILIPETWLNGAYDDFVIDGCVPAIHSFKSRLSTSSSGGGLLPFLNKV